MGRLFKFLLFVIILAVLGVIGFAYLGDLSPEQDAVTEPVELNAQ